MFFGQLPTSLSDGWTLDQAREMMRQFVDELGRFAGRPIPDEALTASFELFNTNRRLLRELFAARRGGNGAFTSGELQALVKSGMVMDRAEHTVLLRQVIADLADTPRDDRIRVHLSGHLCHAPKPELLAAIEECGAIVVDDDLFTGTRYVTAGADLREDSDPVESLARRYLSHDADVPCPTRVKHESDWEDTLVAAVEGAGAEGVIVLMVRFCEPHMLYYPELRRRLDQRGIPNLLIETEHEGLPVETVRTRVEAFLERIRRNTTRTSTLEVTV
jgi:benzoyl-CoA reductase/2-hydroxyglutaryl-CoA dehydratase subunit BcrC/BadD/HgdB